MLAMMRATSATATDTSTAMMTTLLLWPPPPVLLSRLLVLCPLLPVGSAQHSLHAGSCRFSVDFLGILLMFWWQPASDPRPGEGLLAVCALHYQCGGTTQPYAVARRNEFILGTVESASPERAAAAVSIRWHVHLLRQHCGGVAAAGRRAAAHLRLVGPRRLCVLCPLLRLLLQPPLQPHAAAVCCAAGGCRTPWPKVCCQRILPSSASWLVCRHHRPELDRHIGGGVAGAANADAHLLPRLTLNTKAADGP